MLKTSIESDINKAAQKQQKKSVELMIYVKLQHTTNAREEADS